MGVGLKRFPENEDNFGFSGKSSLKITKNLKFQGMSVCKHLLSTARASG